MDYTKITEAYGNLIKEIKEAGMDVTVSRIVVKEYSIRDLFIKIKANKSKKYKLLE